MKKFSLLILCILVLIPSMVSAHTHLAVSNPSDGQVVADDLEQITLTFDGNIEQLSSMKVVKNGIELKGLQVQIEAEKMFGSLPEPLENGDYIIQWNIAGEDGHPLAGEINFTVQKDEKSEEQSTTVPEQGQDSAGANEDNKTTIDGSDKSEEVSSQNPNISLEENTKSNTTTIVTIIGFVIILGVGLLLLRKKPLL